MQHDILITGCTVLREDFSTAEDQTIAIQNGRIASVGPTGAAQDAKLHIDGRGKLFMPGLGDGHTHLCQTMLRGRILDELPMIWTRIMLPFESGLTTEVVRTSAEIACLEMIKSGTTAFADAGGLFMETAAEVALQSGLRAALTCSTIDSGNAPPSMKCTTAEALAHNDALYDAFHSEGQGRLRVFYSLRAMQSCSEALTVQTFERAALRGTNVHAHISEYPGEVMGCLEAHGLRPLEYLAQLGVLGPNFLAAHALLLSSNEMALAAQHGVKVVHCPFSNSGKAVPATPALLERGVAVGLGTDGAAHGGLSLWNEMKIFRCVMNAQLGVPGADPVVMPAKTILRMATAGSAAAMGNGDDTGVLREGAVADLISLDIRQPHFAATSSLANTLLECANANDVQDVIVNGRIIMQNRSVLTLDEERILADAARLHQKLFGTNNKKGMIA